MILEILNTIDKLRKKWSSLYKNLKIEEKKKKIKELEQKMSSASFWKDIKSTSKITEEFKSLKKDVEDMEKIGEKLKGLEELASLNDSSLEKELEEELKRIERRLNEIELSFLFFEEFDNSNAIVEINAGAGGTEACDWVSMLFRMYFRWAEDKKFRIKVLDELKGEEAGIKNITFLVEGKFAYGLLKSEKGVHRLVRISPFDANRRRHTSFASVSIIPEIGEEEVKINPADLKIETFRASGHGGQHVNRTDSAVRITHLPTRVVVSCQNERSQYQNRQTALRILKAKLYALEKEKKRERMEKICGEKKKIEWGNQIRSYILHPYLLVKDHRTQFETSSAYEVLDGKIDDFIYHFLRQNIKND